MIKQIEKKSISFNAVLNILKQCCSLIFPLITYPYVARTLGPTNLGKYSFAESVVQYFLLLAGLGVSSYAIREGSRIRSDKEKISKFASEVFSINFFAMIISYAILLLLIYFVPQLHGYQTLILILAISVLTQTIGRDWVNSVYEDYIYITLRYIAFQILALILIFLFVRDQDDYIIYTCIMLFASAGGNIMNFVYTRRYIPIKLTVHINIKKHIKPILYLFCTAVAITIYVKSDITMIGFMLTDEDVGIYTLSSKIYTIVNTLVGAVITVTIPRLSVFLGSNNIDAYNGLLNRLRKILCIIACPAAVGLYFLSEPIMILLGGSAYQSGYVSLSILCIATVISNFACFYATGVLVANRKEKYYFAGTIISSIVNVCGNFVLIPLCGINGAAITTVISETIVFLICRHYARDYVVISDDGNLKTVLVGCIGISCCCLFIRKLFTSDLITVIVSMVCSILLYAVIMILFKNKIVIEFINTIITRLNNQKNKS